ncbi:MAG: flavin reductase family protein [Lachnospiraceae bacterium]|nr:flavin reductase family protein [Lachnospira sp.]MBR6697083.1 flavin reductase family protein [Lachnospiraceae bacterium]
MAKISWKPGNMIYPLPAVMVTVGDGKGNDNIITVAWTGTVCTNPPMAYISVRPERYSYNLIKETKEFVINLTTKDLCFATDYCGVKSGRDVDKFKETGLHKEKAKEVSVPLIAECPVNIECRVREEREYGSHTMFIADVVNVNVDDKYMDETNKFNLQASGLMAYSHGEYYDLNNKLGSFGYSVKKNGKK